MKRAIMIFALLASASILVSCNSETTDNITKTPQQTPNTVTTENNKNDTVEKYSEGLIFELDEDADGYILKPKGTCTDERIVILPMYCDKPVVGLGGYAFKDCVNIKSVVIPDSVKKMGNNVFRSCHKLKDIYYTGSEEEWNELTDKRQMDVSDIKIHYNWK